MWFCEVEARAFGPLHSNKGDHLKFAPGLNIVHGPNEAGKSSWHAALMAALCGRRRGRGRTKDEATFVEQHRPWSSGDDGPWAVAVEMERDTGARMRIGRDLRLNETTISDPELGDRRLVDIESEILHDGSPDGALLVGLNRNTFAMAASVCQASVIADLDMTHLPVKDREERRGALRALLERVANENEAVSAVEAINGIDQYKRKIVGEDKENRTGLLRRAAEDMRAAKRHLVAVRGRRGAYENSLEALESLSQVVDEIREYQTGVQSRSEVDPARRETESSRRRESTRVRVTVRAILLTTIVIGVTVGLFAGVVAGIIASSVAGVIASSVAWFAAKGRAKDSVPNELRSKDTGRPQNDLEMRIPDRRRIHQSGDGMLAQGRAAPPVPPAEQSWRERSAKAHAVFEGLLDSDHSLSAWQELTGDVQAMLRSAEANFNRASGVLEGVKSTEVDVGAAEAKLGEALREHERMLQLRDVLAKAEEHLQAAVDNAYRTLAPQISEKVSDPVSQVTNGRYRRVLVDPADLSVRLETASGERRDSRHVSRGTTEQVYLALRVVLAEVLSTGREKCPLLLDDPTVHADSDRKATILEFLLEVANDRQVILFSQEQQVLDWAHSRKDAGVHLIELGSVQPA